MMSATPFKVLFGLLNIIIDKHESDIFKGRRPDIP